MSFNLWFEDVIDAFLGAAAEGRDWRAAVADANKANRGRPRRILTQEGLRAKGIRYSRQHIRRRVVAGTFPAPFQLPQGAA
jgi:hypothetical protein